jgi:membrane dipeptidase
MKIIDTHCDALFRLQEAKWANKSLDFRDATELDTNLKRLEQGGVAVQFFAIFLDPDIPSDQMWDAALEQIDLFHEEVLQKNPKMKHITSWEQLDQLQNGEIGAVLTLEGAEPIGNDLQKLQRLYQKGIMSIGLTWNPANLCADGAGEPRGGGLTMLGKEVVRLNNEHKVLTDVSHLSIKAFWDVLEQAAYPFASHSNARKICDHPRNLNDEQIKAMIAKNAPMHVVFNPPFINQGSDSASITDLIRHIDHICELGGEKLVGFGSDFDGIDDYITDLEDAGKYPNLINALLKNYTTAQVTNFAYHNFINHRPK